MLKNPNLGKVTRVFVTSILCVFVFTAASFIAQQFIENDTVSSLIGYTPLVAMAFLFTFGGLRAGYITGIRGKNLLSGFGRGVKTIAPAIPLIVFVLAITYVLKKGMILDTILYHIYNLIQDFSPVQALLMIMLVVIVIEFFIGSGTAKAFLLMPLILPCKNAQYHRSVYRFGFLSRRRILQCALSDKRNYDYLHRNDKRYIRKVPEMVVEALRGNLCGFCGADMACREDRILLILRKNSK